MDNDFFHWVHNDKYFNKLKATFRTLAQELSLFDFNNVDEDVLKGVYQELIDLDTRLALGEYYTPDWLCERVVNEFNFKPTDKILDPSCGSGSFLRASIHQLKKLHPNLSPEQINACVYGIDIHPLSVQIAKTTVLISLGKGVGKYQQPIYINVILANTLLAPEGVNNLFGGEFRMDIDREKLLLSTQILGADNDILFNTAIDVCEELATVTMHKAPINELTLSNAIAQQLGNTGFNDNISASFYKIYGGLKIAKEKGRDSIWSFIIKNLYKPYFLAKQFNYVIGNPPWFTYSSVKNKEYQLVLKTLAEKYEVKPTEDGTLPHLEIAAIFLAYCSAYFLKEEGQLAFVLPRSFCNGKQHDNTRSSKALGFALTSIWDLNNVSPLFNIPSAVLFATHVPLGLPKSFPTKGLQGLSFEGKVPSHNCNYTLAQQKLTETEVTWFYAKQGKSSAFSTTKLKTVTKLNPYKKQFKQGAIIVPRTFYFVETKQVNEVILSNPVQTINTSPLVVPDAKMPWKEIKMQGQIESKFLFRTALSKSILPFALHNPDLVTLPILVHNTPHNDGTPRKHIELLAPEKLLTEGYLKAYKWFTNIENIWQIHRTELNVKYTATNYINYQNKLSTQNLNAPYLVLYNASAKDANATIVQRSAIDLEFIVESVAYVLYTHDINEAYYLTAILNATLPNKMMKDFQARGLFGPRHVHKKILDIYYPKFNTANATHLKLAELSALAHSKALAYITNNAPTQPLSALHLGKLRTEIKKQVATEITAIDKLVKTIIN